MEGSTEFTAMRMSRVPTLYVASPPPRLPRVPRDPKLRAGTVHAVSLALRRLNTVIFLSDENISLQDAVLQMSFSF